MVKLIFVDGTYFFNARSILQRALYYQTRLHFLRLTLFWLDCIWCLIAAKDTRVQLMFLLSASFCYQCNMWSTGVIFLTNPSLLPGRDSWNTLRDDLYWWVSLGRFINYALKSWDVSFSHYARVLLQITARRHRQWHSSAVAAEARWKCFPSFFLYDPPQLLSPAWVKKNIMHVKFAPAVKSPLFHFNAKAMFSLIRTEI